MIVITIMVLTIGATSNHLISQIVIVSSEAGNFKPFMVGLFKESVIIISFNHCLLISLILDSNTFLQDLVLPNYLIQDTFGVSQFFFQGSLFVGAQDVKH